MYKFLNFFGIKEHNKFVALFFVVLTILAFCYIGIQAASLLFGNGQVAFSPSPYLYAIMLTFPPIAYSYAVNSKLIIGRPARIRWFIITTAAFGMIGGSLAITVINNTLWYLIKLIPTYELVRNEYPELFGPAFKTLSFVGPFIYMFSGIDFAIMILRDEDHVKGIGNFPGLSVDAPAKVSPSFLCSNIICNDFDTAKPVIVDEKKRMESTLVQGATGTGKTAMVLLPMSARDIEKKFFIREYSKKIAFSLLKKGVAYIEGPYTNEYININFNLDYIKPKKGHEEEFYQDLENVILYKNSETGEVVFRGLGITVVENDGQYVDNFTKVARNFDMEVLTIDPVNPESTLSMNPFAIENPAKVASIIADVLKSMQQNEGGKEETFFAQVTSDAFQNLAILLKEMYPRLNNGDLPSLEDVLDLLYNFDKVEEMAEDMKKIPELFEKYKLLIAYFEKNFYKPSLNINGYEIPGTKGSGRKDTERFLYGAITQLNNLLRHPGIKRSLCGRTNVIDFDAALREGKIITACSRKGELGVIGSKAFGMFFILQFQDAVLRRKGSEDSRIPHFLYIDEFPEYINKDTEVMFTLFRKYRCGVVIAIQNLSQLEKNKGFEYYRQVVLANTKTQIVFGDTVPEDSEYWNKAFGEMKKIDWTITHDPTGGDFQTSKKLQYKDKERFKIHKIQEHKFGAIYFKTKSSSGNPVIGEGKVSFLADKYKEKHPTFMYNFERFMINKPLHDTIENHVLDPFDKEGALDDDTDTIFDTTMAANINEKDGNIVDNTIDVDFDYTGVDDDTDGAGYKNNVNHENNYNYKSEHEQIIKDDNDHNDGIKSASEDPIVEPKKDFDFSSDDDFDIVIDTSGDDDHSESIKHNKKK